MENPNVCTSKLSLILTKEKKFSQAEIDELNQKRYKKICKFFRGGQGCARKTCLFQHPYSCCKYYSHPQDCKFGKKCRFVHFTDVPLQHRDTMDKINDPRVDKYVRI